MGAAMGVVIVYDICDRTTFDHAEYWIEQIVHHGDAQLQRILVGNRSDSEELRQVAREEGDALAVKFETKFFETCTKTGHQVEEPFLALADQVVARRYAGPLVRGVLPRGTKKLCNNKY